jgi:hypothetical protein
MTSLDPSLPPAAALPWTPNNQWRHSIPVQPRLTHTPKFTPLTDIWKTWTLTKGNKIIPLLISVDIDLSHDRKLCCGVGPDPGEQKWLPKKEKVKEIHVFEMMIEGFSCSWDVLCGGQPINK